MRGVAHEAESSLGAGARAHSNYAVAVAAGEGVELLTNFRRPGDLAVASGPPHGELVEVRYENATLSRRLRLSSQSQRMREAP